MWWEGARGPAGGWGWGDRQGTAQAGTEDPLRILVLSYEQSRLWKVRQERMTGPFGSGRGGSASALGTSGWCRGQVVAVTQER